MLVRLLVGIFLFAESVYAACPSRVSTYVAGTIISPTAVSANEDALFEGIQDGLETGCIADNAITTAKIAVGAVTSADILDGTITTTDLAFAINPGNTLPAGAVFFMVTGSCPSWTTDVSATYSNLFMRVNSSPGTTGGSNTHTHTAGSYAGSSHTHAGTTDIETQPPADGSGGTIGADDDHTHPFTTSAGGGGAISGTSDSGTNIPAFVTARLCQVS